ncbi:N-acetyldiaminopimelate deacetylase [Pediococcus argentinicus]|uniref:N-acetyldiaminopimelate deacetylase n=1 Tax=Pediococcus argentinicus TaxID=480391 RepID=UPI0033903FEA
MTELLANDLSQIRRALHQIPELALQEFQTHDFLLNEVRHFNQEFLTIHEIPALPTGLLVRVDGSAPKRTLGYRADIDALPVEEETGLEFKSQHKHTMHACGHDLHMTVALGILNHFAEHQPVDNIVFFFQPAEESENGGKLAFEQGVFTDEWNLDEIYALHDTPDYVAGNLACRPGVLFAGTTEVDIKLIGKSGHAGFPHEANDMVVAASNLVVQLQTIVSRNVDPTEGGVFTIGQLQAGHIRNVIAGEAELHGTVRGFSQDMIMLIRKRINEICKGIELAFDCQVEVKMRQGGYLPVVNNPSTTDRFINFMQQNYPDTFQISKPAMTGEDFGYLLSKIPGTMFWLGVGDTSQLHSSTFNPDEKALEPAVRKITAFLEHRMKEEN